MRSNQKEHLREWAVCLAWLLLALVFATGCGKSTAPVIFPDATPTSLQLSNSHLSQFAIQLKALPGDQRGAAVQQFLRENPGSPLIEGDHLVGIFWYGQARKVSVNGDMQRAWTEPEPLDAIACGENTFFYCVHQAPADARLDYLLNVDGKDTTDPRNPRVTPSGFGPHSEIAMPGFQPNPAQFYRAGIAHGSLDTLIFTNRTGPLQPRLLKVYQPATHDNPAWLPTLYVYDGLEALNYMACTNVLDNLIADGKIQPVLAVFIEMLPEDIQLFPGKLTTLADMVSDEIVPLIDARYPALRAPASRAVTGISAWGNLALTTALSRPDVFLLAAGQSATITDPLMKTLRRATRESRPRQDFRLYLDVGNYDLVNGAMGHLTFLQANQRLKEELERCGVKVFYQVQDDGHQWANWRERTGTILGCFFPAAAR